MAAFDLTFDPDQTDVGVLSSILRDDTASKGIDARVVKPFALFKRDDQGRALAGISGHMVWDWLYIERLAVPNDLRGQGIGKKLVLAAEEMAIYHRCHHAHVNTASYQVPGFYIPRSAMKNMPDCPTIRKDPILYNS